MTIVEKHIEAADAHYKNAAYLEALHDYRVAFFYDASLLKVRARIEQLEEKFADESETLYQEGVKLLNSNKEEALKSFNRAVYINPVHGRAAEQYKKLLQEEPLKAKIFQLERALEKKFTTYQPTENAIALLSQQVKEILVFQHDNKKALSIKSFVEKDRKSLISTYINKGKFFFDDGKFESAGKAFRKAQQLDQEGNEEIRNYLSQIQQLKDFQYTLNLGRSYLHKKKYRQAVILISKVLSFSPKNSAAISLLKEALHGKQEVPETKTKLFDQQRDYINALVSLKQQLNVGKRFDDNKQLIEIIRKKIETEIVAILNRGRFLYEKKEFTEALILLEYVLQVDPQNDIAKTYIKKINSRLETIKSIF